jgi:hypothetical protein
VNEAEDMKATPEAMQTPAIRPKRGRPVVVTPEKVKEIGQLVGRGLTFEQACLRAGVKYESFRTAWSRNANLDHQLKESLSEFLDTATLRILNGERGWQGAAWLLERRHGSQFRRPPETAVNISAGGHMMEIEVEGVRYTGTRDEFFAMMQATAQKEFTKSRSG